MSLILLAFCGLWGITAPIHFSHPQKSAVFTPQNCPHCGQKWTGWRRKAPGLSPAFSPLSRRGVQNPSILTIFSDSRICRKRLSSLPFLPIRAFFANAPARRRNVRFWASGGYAPGCARKIGHSRHTRLTLVDGRFPAAPVGTLPTAFGCVPARIPRPVLQAFARKTAGWRTEWAGACTKGSHFAFGRPA